MLAIVALRGSVPAQWVIDFKVGLGHYAGFSLDQRGQFEDIFKVRGLSKDVSEQQHPVLVGWLHLSHQPSLS